MTTSAQPSPRRSRLTATAVFIGHYTAKTSALTFGIILAINTLKWWHADIPAPAQPVYGTFLALYLAAFLCEIFAHDLLLCPRDTEDSHVLLDPQHAVDAHMRELRSWHSRRGRILAIIGYLAFLGLLIPQPPANLPTAASLTATALTAAALAAYIWLHRTRKTHHLLQPWCPFCRHPGPDDNDHTPQPAPQPTGTANH